VRITLKKAYTDGTIAVVNPLSLLCRLATSMPPPRSAHHPLRGRSRPGEPPACHYCGNCGNRRDTASFFCSADHLLPFALQNWNCA
jgi:hypothetical protein